MSVAAKAAEPTAEVSLLIDVGSAWTKASVVGRTRGRWRIAASVAQPTAWGEAALEEALVARLAVGVDQRLRERLPEILAAAPRIGCRTPRRTGRLAIAALVDEEAGAVARRAAEAAGWMVVASSAPDDGHSLSERLATLSAADVDAWLLAAPQELLRPEDAAQEASVIASARHERGGPVVWSGPAALTERLSGLFEEGALLAVAPSGSTDGHDSATLRHDLEALLARLVEGHDGRRTAPTGFRRAITELARQERLRIGAVDLGARYASWVLADGGEDPPTVTGGVLAAGGLAAPAFGSPQVAGRLAHQMAGDVGELAVADALQNLRSRPGSVPSGEEELAVAMAAGRVQLAAVAASPGWGMVDLLVGAGRLIAGAPTPARAMQLMLDGLRPVGVTQLALDSAGVLPPLGSVSDDEISEAIGFLRDDLLLPLGTAIVSRGGRPGHVAWRTTLRRAGWPDIGPVEVRVGQVMVLPLARGERADVEIQTDESVSLGVARRGRHLHAQVNGGSVGLVLDARDAPFQLPRRTDDRRSVQRAWQEALLAEPQPRQAASAS